MFMVYMIYYNHVDGLHEGRVSSALQPFTPHSSFCKGLVHPNLPAIQQLRDFSAINIPACNHYDRIRVTIALQHRPAILVLSYVHLTGQRFGFATACKTLPAKPC